MEEKKYEAALERAKSAIKECGDNIGRIKMIESIFPELAESKEENIRKSILMMFKKALPDVFNRYGMNKNDAIAYMEKLKDIDKRLEDAYKTADEVQYKRGYEDGYLEGMASAKQELEKQGEHANFLSKIQVGDKVTRNEDGVLVNLSQLNRVAKKDEKQGAIKDGNSIDPHFRKPITYTETKYPKFKIGDWVVDEEDNHVYQVKRVVTNVSSGMSGYDLSDGGYFYSTKTNCHLWSIADAQDGDILSNGKMIVIFKHLEEPSYRQHIVAYIGLDNSGHIQVTDGHWELGIDKAKPATKEQCELLFRKMAEEGYEWDAEKKELSHKEVSKISDKVWNEDDEKNLQGVIDEIQANKSSAPEYDLKTYDKFLSWLKSIKDRVGCEANCTTMWKPSEEQIKAFEHFVRSIGESGYASPYENNTKLLYSLLEQLKEL